MSHARVEEVSESDSDPSDMDPSDFEPSVITALPTRPRDDPPDAARLAANAVMNPALVPQVPGGSDGAEAYREQIKTWACIYPVYFDINRSRAEGRRVGKEHAVENPLAQEISNATRTLGLMTALEAGKIHPKDWANPGRVKVNVKGNGGVVQNKHHLYVLIAEWLKAHPTTQQSPFNLPIQGLPNPKVVPPVVPRGWKMGSILPLHSPAVTGGGVSENMFKDMMQELQGAGGGGAPGAIAEQSEKKSKKDKKKGKA